MTGIRKQVSRGLAMVGGNLANFALTLGRNKFLALTFGPVGVGWIALVNNMIETFATVGGMGVCDALNRELPRRTPSHTNEQVVSSALALMLLLMVPLLPLAAVLYTQSVAAADASVLATFCFLIACIAASTWRAVSGIYLGLALSRRMFNAIVVSGVLNFAITALLIWMGVRNLMTFVVMTPVLLALQGLWGARHYLRDLITRTAMREFKAWRPILAIALPVTCGLLLEPLTILTLRSTTAARFGQNGVGLIQTGMIFVVLSAAMFNSFNGMTLARWDQTGEPSFSRRFMLMFAVALGIPAVGITVAFLISPIWSLLIWLFFSSSFLPGAVTVPWFLSGELMRMGGSILNMTLLSRNYGYLTVVPRLSGLATAFLMVQFSTITSILDIGKIYACAYGSSFAVSIVLWLFVQVRFRAATVAGAAA